MSSSVGAQGVDIKEQQAREMAPPATLSRAAELQMLRAAGKRLVLDPAAEEAEVGARFYDDESLFKILSQSFYRTLYLPPVG